MIYKPHNLSYFHLLSQIYLSFPFSLNHPELFLVLICHGCLSHHLSPCVWLIALSGIRVYTVTYFFIYLTTIMEQMCTFKIGIASILNNFSISDSYSLHISSNSNSFFIWLLVVAIRAAFPLPQQIERAIFITLWELQIGSCLFSKDPMVQSKNILK